MKLQAPFIQLPLRFDAPALAAEIDAMGEAPWRPHPQGFEGNSMLPLVAVDGDPANEGFAGAMQATPWLQQCAYLRQVMGSLGVVLGRSRLMRLSGNAEVKVHVDQGYYWTERMRVHVPIVTQPGVRFECGGAVINMAAGDCWIFDTWRPHCVVNDATAARIHLVVDTVGGDGFWSLAAGGRRHDAGPSATWQPRVVGPGSSTPTLAFESINVPVVMSPWELTAQLAQLFGEVLPHPQLEPVARIAGELTRTWRALWAQYGDDPAGHARFRAAMAQFIAHVREPAAPLELRNDVKWFGAMMMAVGKFAVVQAPSGGDDGMTDRG